MDRVHGTRYRRHTCVFAHRSGRTCRRERVGIDVGPSVKQAEMSRALVAAFCTRLGWTRIPIKNLGTQGRPAAVSSI
jgi:hypothetical protein